MREGADKNYVEHSLQAKVSIEVNETGSGAKRNLSRQEEHVSPATHVARPETGMVIPEHAPMWYRHWGLNE
jgi:hypothetical protein